MSAYSTSYIHKIIKEKHGIYVTDKNIIDLQRFCELFFLELRYGNYILYDVSFEDLTPEKKRAITLSAFRLWRTYKYDTKNKEDFN